MEQLIETVNQLQDVFTATGSHGLIDLPHIVVIGAQSSGKSSVLEHLVGKPFLPIGPGVVTRCPLVIQMVQMQGKPLVDEYAIFQHNQAKVFTDYSLIRQEIEDQTGRLANNVCCGKNKGICSTPINLKMYSTSALNLTMVDLPGLTKVPVGDLPQDIEQKTKDIILRYIENPNCIILVVTPANVDMVTSESLKIAREVDPEGVRTLVVVTKMDLLEEGTDAYDMLMGKVIPVKLGIIGVVNNSRQDILEGKNIMQSVKEFFFPRPAPSNEMIDEAGFFRSKYSSIAAQHGTPYLIQNVQNILISPLRKCLPKLRQDISKKLSVQHAELHILGDSKLDKPTLLLDLLTKFSNTYSSAIKGNLSNIQTKKLYGGARINYVFQETFSNALKSIDPLSGLSREDILTAMQNASGTNPTLFVPEIAFELLVKRQIARLRIPCIQCVDLVHEELNKIVQDSLEDSNLHRFPNLQKEISGVATELLKSRMPITNKMVDHFIEVQLTYINTAHPDFLPNLIEEALNRIVLPYSLHDKELNRFPNFEKRISGVVTELLDGRITITNEIVDHFIDVQQTYTNNAHPDVLPNSIQGSSLAIKKEKIGQIVICPRSLGGLRISKENEEPLLTLDKGHRDCVIIQELIKSYFSVVKTLIQDTVPKIIIHFMVNFVVHHIQLELVSKLYKSDVKDLLEESKAFVDRRKELKQIITTLEEANVTLNNLERTTISANEGISATF